MQGRRGRAGAEASLKHFTIGVYLRFLRTMCVDEGEAGRLDVPASVTLAVAICAGLVLLFGVWPQPFLDASFKAAASLLGHG